MVDVVKNETCKLNLIHSMNKPKLERAGRLLLFIQIVDTF